LAIRRQGAGWNESGYQASQVGSFTDLLGQGSIEDQLSNIGNLEKAYNAQYNAELVRLNSAQDVAQNAYNEQVAQINDKYQLELDVYNSIRQTLESLKQSADDLLLSDLSTLTNEQKFNEAQSQYNSTLSLAKTGDADALGQLSGISNAYLQEAQGFYASSGDYSNIFDQVHGALSGLGSQSISAPQKQASPVHPSIASHNDAIRELQGSTVESLLELKDLMAALEAQSDSEFDLAMTALNEVLAADTALLHAEIATTNSLISQQTDVLADISQNVATPAPIIINVPAPLIHPPKPQFDNGAQLLAEIKEMKEINKKQAFLLEQRTQQADSQFQQSQTGISNLNKSVVNGNDVTERQFDELEKRQVANQ